MPKSESLTSLFAHSPFFKEQLEQFAQLAHNKRATMCDSLTSLFKKDEQIPNTAKMVYKICIANTVILTYTYTYSTAPSY